MSIQTAPFDSAYATILPSRSTQEYHKTVTDVNRLLSIIVQLSYIKCDAVLNIFADEGISSSYGSGWRLDRNQTFSLRCHGSKI